jgi:hypothetical protein
VMLLLNAIAVRTKATAGRAWSPSLLITVNSFVTKCDDSDLRERSIIF